MNLTPRDRKVIRLGIVVVVTAIALKFAVMPLINKWQSARTDIVAHRAAIAAIDQRVNRLRAMHTLLQPAYGKAMEQPLSDVNTTRLAFHKCVQDLFKSSGIAFDSIQPQETRKLRDVAGVVTVGLRITGTCQLPQLTKCLTEMRRAEHIFIVESVDVTSDAKKPGHLAVTMLLSTPTRGSVK